MSDMMRKRAPEQVPKVLKRSPAGTWPLRFGIVAAACVIAGIALATLGLLPPLIGLGLYAMGGLVGHLALFGGVLAMRRGRSRRAGIASLLGVVSAASLLVPTLLSMGYPRINDITTDIVEPPSFEHAQRLPELQGANLGYPEPFKALVRISYPTLRTLFVAEPTAVVFERAEALARERWELSVREPDTGRIEAVATSALFRFKDDVVLRVRAAPGGTNVDMRSRSRVGQGDLGANAARIAEFLDALASQSPNVSP